MHAVQFDLFEKEQVAILNRRIEELEQTIAHLRRGLFARYHDLEGRLLKLELKPDNETRDKI